MMRLIFLFVCIGLTSCSAESDILNKVISEDIISIKLKSELIYSKSQYFEGDYNRMCVYLIDESSHSDLVIDFFHKYQAQFDSSWTYNDQIVGYCPDEWGSLHYELEYVRGSRILILKEIKI